MKNLVWTAMLLVLCTAASPAHAQPCAAEAAIVTQGLTDASAQLSSLHAAVETAEPPELVSALVATLANVAFPFADASLQLAALQAQGCSITDEVILAFEDASLRLQSASAAIAVDDFGGGRDGLAAFAADLETIIGSESFADEDPTMAAVLHQAPKQARAAASALDWVAIDGGQATTLDLLATIVDTANTPLAELMSDAADLLSVDDPLHQSWLGLDDPEVIAGLSDIAGLVAHPETTELIGVLQADPGGWARAAASFGAADALANVGNALAMTSAAAFTGHIYAFCGISCPDLCESDEDCEDCHHCKTGVGDAGNTPDDYGEADFLIDALTRFPKMTPGMGGGARKATKSFLANYKAKNAHIYIKVCWETCTSVSCWVFWTQKKCVEQESAWIQVPYSANWSGWPRPSTWGSAKMQAKIQKAIDKAVAEACD